MQNFELCKIILMKDDASLDAVKNLDKSNCIFLWCDTRNINGLLAINNRMNELRSKGFLYDLITIDLIRAGFPPMTEEEFQKEYCRIGDLYADFIKENFEPMLINLL